MTVEHDFTSRRHPDDRPRVSDEVREASTAPDITWTETAFAAAIGIVIMLSAISAAAWLAAF